VAHAGILPVHLERHLQIARVRQTFTGDEGTMTATNTGMKTAITVMMNAGTKMVRF
jgi:hypothetical protein